MNAAQLAIVVAGCGISVAIGWWQGRRYEREMRGKVRHL